MLTSSPNSTQTPKHSYPGQCDFRSTLFSQSPPHVVSIKMTCGRDASSTTTPGALTTPCSRSLPNQMKLTTSPNSTQTPPTPPALHSEAFEGLCPRTSPRQDGNPVWEMSSRRLTPKSPVTARGNGPPGLQMSRQTIPQTSAEIR